MDAHLKTPESKIRGHSRTSSDDRRRVATLRRSSKGPLDDPLQSIPSTSPPPLSTNRSTLNRSPSTNASPPNRSPSRRPASLAVGSAATLQTPRSRQSSRSPHRPPLQSDLSFLLQPQNFLPLPQPALYKPPEETENSSLPQLVENGRFYTAAVACARHLTNLPSSAEPAVVFDLIYTRLACLTLMQQTKVAAAESKVLGDLTSVYYRHPDTDVHMVPWHLRVLAVRLQALGFGEWRRGIMAYYVLAHEARQEAMMARDGEDGRRPDDEMLWKARLHELGLKVASALIEMGDLQAAARHLNTLDMDPGIDAEEKERMTVMEILTWLKVGDVLAAQKCLSRLSGAATTTTEEHEKKEPSSAEQSQTAKVINALLIACQGDFKAAVQEWRNLHAEFPTDSMIAQNLAVCLIYTGDIIEARSILESLVEERKTPVFQTMLFNLCTIYELCGDMAPQAKSRLVERVGSADPTGAGWEKSTVEFKL